MAKLSAKSVSKTHRLIVYGGAKSGKTQLVGELAEFYDMIWVDMENGHDTLFKLPKAYQDRIELIELPDTRSYPIAIETCLKMIKGPVAICEKHGKVNCMLCTRETKPFISLDLPSLTEDTIVVFDSLTQLNNSAIAHITKNQPEDYKLEFDDWGNLGKLLDIFLSHLQQAKYNVIVISHETEAETEGGKKVLVPVGGTRNFSRNLARYFDHVIYAEKKNKKHVFASSTLYATNILTGSRTDVVLENSDKPSLLAIFKPEIFAERSKITEAVSVKSGLNNNVSNSTNAILAKLRKK